MDIRLQGALLLHADGQTDIMKLIVTFRNFVNASKNITLYLVVSHFKPVHNLDSGFSRAILIEASRLCVYP